MSLRPYRAVAFDLDGTLIDTAPDLAAALDRAFANAGYLPPGIRRVRGWIGDGPAKLVQRAMANAGVPEDYFDRIFSDFHDFYGSHIYQSGSIYPGVEVVLQQLAGKGFGLCCVTNKEHGLADCLLQQSGLRAYLQFVLGGDSVRRKKPAPELLLTAAARFNIRPAELLLVGDLTQDQQAATRAGADFVFVTYGYGSIAQEAGGHCLARIDEITELTGLVGSME